MVHIVQCLCPKRHAILAMAYEPPHPDPTGALKKTVEAFIEAKAINPYCGICFSREFSYEDAESKFETLKEAEIPLAQSMAAQFEAQAWARRHLSMN